MTFYYFLAGTTQIIWGLTPSASKLILEYLPVETYSAIRYTFSGLLFLLIAVIKQKAFLFKFKSSAKVGLLGILAYGLSSLGTLYGLKLGGALNFGFASSFNSIITAGMAIVLLKEHPRSYFQLGATLSILGGLLLFWGKFDLSNFQIAGGSLMLIWSSYIFENLAFIYSNRIKGQYSLYEYLAISQLSAAIFMWGITLIKNGAPHQISQMPPLFWGSLVYVCFFSCGFAYLIWYWLLNFLEGHKMAFFDCFHTLSAAIMAFLIFHEPQNWKMITGGFLLLLAVWAILIPKKSVILHKT